MTAAVAAVPVEEWRPAVGFEGRYEVSNMGRVRSLERLVKSKNGRTWISPGKVLSASASRRSDSNRWRYAQVRPDNGPSVKVHVLVLEAFHGLRPPGLLARHLSGDARDNSASNLRWGTNSENQLDRTEHGGCPAAEREACPRGHVLAMPNLRQCIPTRACLACARSTTAANTAKRAGRAFDKGAYADAAYERIMQHSPRQRRGESGQYVSWSKANHAASEYRHQGEAS